ncbi:MAG: hypothetical protein IJQ28_00525, partial [Clostridia bacterium]|nr:hypothetical protein [Clostridia bacterium]
MQLHRIADLTVDLGYKYDRMKKQAAAYRIENGKKPDMTIYISDDFLQTKCQETEGLTPDVCEYVYTGSVFYTGLLHFGGFMLHSSAVLMDGNAYLFSAS